MDRVEQVQRLACLVGLQRSQQVQFDTGIGFAPGWPFPGCFLHPVFPEQAVAFIQNRNHPFGGLHLGHRDQAGAALGAACPVFGGMDTRRYFFQGHGTPGVNVPGILNHAAAKKKRAGTRPALNFDRMIGWLRR